MNETELNNFADQLLAPEETQEAGATPQADASQETPDGEEEPQGAGEALEEVTEAEAESADDVEGVADEPEAIEESKTFTVKVDGREVNVSLDELTRGYSGQAYIQQRMQEAATHRKQVEQARQQLSAERQQFVDLQQQIQTNGALQKPTPPEPSLSQSDPFAYMQQNAQYQHDIQQFDAQQQQIRLQYEQHQQAESQAMQAHLHEQREIMLETIPELRDETTREKFTADMVKTAQDVYGLSADQVGSVTDARQVNILADAMRYQQLKAAKPIEVSRPARTVKPTAKGKKTSSEVRRNAIQAAKKTQTNDDWASLIFKE